MNAMKQGYKTTEFWLTLAASFVGLLLTSGVITSDNVLKILGMASMVLSALGYTASRTITKGNESRRLLSEVLEALPPKQESKSLPIVHDKILAVVGPDVTYSIEVLTSRSAPVSSLVLQLAEGADVFSVEDIRVGGESQWEMPTPASVFRAHPIVVFEKRKIKSGEKIEIVVKNRSDKQAKIFGEVAAVLDK